MSNRRDSWQPGGGGNAPSTPVVRSDGVKRVERKPTPPPTRKEEEPEAPVVIGATGRGLPVGIGPAPESLPPTEPDDEGPRRPVGPSPFSGYAPSANELARSAAAGAESSNQIAAIVMGMGFVLSMVSILVLVILMVGFFAWRTLDVNDGLADADKDNGHVMDTAVADEIVRKTPVPRPRKPGDPDPEAETPDPGSAAPTEGPVTITVPEHVFFHSLEINCPDAGIRRRASFRGRKATATGVPINEDCLVTFQGSEPAKTYVRGGQTKDCVRFNPTECRLL